MERSVHLSSAIVFMGARASRDEEEEYDEEDSYEEESDDDDEDDASVRARVRVYCNIFRVAIEFSLLAFFVA